MKRTQADLGITAAAAVLACAAAAANAPVAVTAVLGVLLFAAPGYLLGQLLLGGNGSVLERVAVATGLAFCVPILGGLLLYAAGLRLHRSTWLGLFTGVVFVCDVVLFFRRRSDQPTSLSREQQGWRKSVRPAAAIGAAVVIAACAVGVARVGVAMQHYPGYTQLWLVRPNQNTSTLDLGVGNYEGKTIRYRLVLDRNGHPAATWNLILANGQAWHQSPRYPDHYTISVNLFRLPDLTHPYRHVSLDGNGTPLP
jgi:hypothetical protein